jgi:hypothetical protein
VIPFTSDDHLEAAGQTILKLLHKAADVGLLSAPPRTLDLTEISRFSASKPQFDWSIAR